MDPRNYLEEIMVPTIEDYAANVTSVRHALLACIATYHAVDYFSAPQKPGNLRKKWNYLCPNFALIDGIAHAAKHVSSGDKSTGNLLTVEDVISRPPAVWDQAVWDLSRWDDPVGGVTLTNNRGVDLLAALERALAFLGLCLPAVEDRWVKSIARWADSDARIQQVYLFGSRVKGNHTYQSDLDIAVVISGDDQAERESYAIPRAAQWRESLGATIPVKIDLQIASPESDNTVWPAVQEHGKRIYPSDTPYRPKR